MGSLRAVEAGGVQLTALLCAHVEAGNQAANFCWELNGKH